MLKIKLQDLLNAIPVWQELTSIKKDPSKAFDIRTYWRSHIKPNNEVFTEEHKALLLAAGAEDDGSGNIKIPDDISATKEKKLNEDFKALCDKEIEIPTLKLTLRQLALACKEPISEATLDSMEKFCTAEAAPASKKKSKKPK